MVRESPEVMSENTADIRRKPKVILPEDIMQPVKKARKTDSIRMFEPDWVERFSHVHPVTPLLFWAPVILFLFWRTFMVHELGILPFFGIAMAGLFVWTFAEYVLHRFIFHFPIRGPVSRKLVFWTHGIHHMDPDDLTRLVMTPFLGVLYGVPLFLLFRWMMGPVWVEPFFAFFLIGYLVYDYTHWYVHAFTPKTRFGKMVKQHHMLHHFATHDARFGVSSPLWDYIFGTTGVAQKAGSKSRTA